ncbi:hypothetical protein IB244_05925 [Rhizobium sp. RHZ02]|nr:hypothetical protein [Rhizobium sp. RHZ02]
MEKSIGRLQRFRLRNQENMLAGREAMIAGLQGDLVSRAARVHRFRPDRLTVAGFIIPVAAERFVFEARRCVVCLCNAPKSDQHACKE